MSQANIKTIKLTSVRCLETIFVASLKQMTFEERFDAVREFGFELSKCFPYNEHQRGLSTAIQRLHDICPELFKELKEINRIDPERIIRLKTRRSNERSS